MTTRPNRTHASDVDRRCDGVSRRDVLTIGALTAFGITNAMARGSRARADESAPPRRERGRSAILVWLDGGPSHLETFDLKPDAPREVRGPFRPISARADGLRICELMTETAKVADRLSVIRSMTSPLGEHNFASHYLLTGFRPSPALEYPSLGSVLSRFRSGDRALPPYVGVGDRINGMAGPGYLPGDAAPFLVGGDPARPDFRVRDLDPYPRVSEERLLRRRRFIDELDAFHRSVERAAESAQPGARSPSSAELERAYRLILSPEAKRAFDVSEESDATRDRYGRRTLGQSCLIARRLIERGVPFVTVTDRGWDTHESLVLRLQEGYTGGQVGKIPTLDRALGALVRDLDERGLLAETLVIVMGEFGRTPKINTAGGRDHWPRAFSVALAGAGVPGGQVIGSSDANGESPTDRAIAPEDLARTIYSILGVDPDHEFTTSDGRPVRVNRDGALIDELLA